MLDNDPYRAPPDAPSSMELPPMHRMRLASVAVVTTLSLLPLLNPNLLLLVLALFGGNLIASPILALAGHPKLAGVALIAATLLFATLLLSNWGFSMPEPVVRFAWPAFVPACILMAYWIAWPLLPVQWRVSPSVNRNDGSSG